MGSEHYCLRWNNHQSNLLGVFSQLLRDERLVDVTLACSEGHSIRAHKVVLSACSSYFQSLFVDHPSRHPIVILKDVRFAELRTLIDFMYKGEVNVEYCQLSALLKTAESLKVKGLAEMTRDCKTETEQTEPTELVTRKSHSIATLVRNDDESSEPTSRSSPIRNKESPSRVENENPSNSNDGFRGDSPTGVMCVEEDVPNNMIIHNNTAAVSSSHLGGCGRLSPPIASELPGTSTLPPVQQVPLSLKKEVDWGGGSEEKDSKEVSTDLPMRSHQDPECLNSSSIDKPSSSTQSSRSSTPFTIPPFPSFTSSLLEMSLLHSGLLNEELFRCSSCMAAFPSVWLLEQHNALQHLGAIGSIDKPFICEQCGQSYRYRSAYVKHREQNHRARLPADKLFSCDVCGMQFRYLKSFKKHRLNHALEKLHGKIGNDQTSSIFSNIKIEEKDENDEYNQNSDKKLCDNSSEVSSSNEIISKQEEANSVIKMESNEEKDSATDGPLSDAEVEKIDSEEQDNTVDSIGPLRSSFEAGHHQNNSPILNFYRNVGENLNRQRDRKFACPFCGKCVRSKENLKLHVRKHTGERPFVCLFCGRAFGGKSDLTRHLRIHTGERPYHCDMCGKCFARADYLSKHLTTHINTPR